MDKAPPAASPVSCNRRDFVRGVASAAVLTGIERARAQDSSAASSGKRPNVVLYVADETRWDFIRAYGLNPTARTPNLDKVFERGVTFTHAVTNQPLCSPSRACMMTGRYATETDVWTLGRQLRHDLPTLATVLRSHGYTANFIGKWHLSVANGKEGLGFVRPEDRGGFLDLWEGANVLELTSHPYSGTIWDSNGQPIEWHDQYRVDFLTDRAVHFLRQPQQKPFLLFISQLEPHQQNDEGRFVAPNGYAERFENPYVPPDLLHLPGDWQKQLPDYYGCIEKIDESVGTILQTLEEQHLLDNTIFLFTSDHGCHFRTRNQEYKRSPHDSSIRVPFLLQGPGLDQSLQLDQIVGTIDLTPTLLDAAGAGVPPSMKGRSLMPLVRDPKARQGWDNTQLIQISQSMVGRALRTKEWTYCVADPSLDGGKVESSTDYQEYVMYNDFADPAQLVNLAARVPWKREADDLRDELIRRIQASGETAPTITQAKLYP
jgi:arylsulfatase A-like enzyme